MPFPSANHISFQSRAKSGMNRDNQSKTRSTPREYEIIRHLAEGKSNQEIAARLGITVRTVETHRSKIMLKLGLHSLAELIHYALDNEIISAKGTG